MLGGCPTSVDGNVVEGVCVARPVADGAVDEGGIDVGWISVLAVSSTLICMSDRRS